MRFIMANMKISSIPEKRMLLEQVVKEKENILNQTISELGRQLYTGSHEKTKTEIEKLRNSIKLDKEQISAYKKAEKLMGGVQEVKESLKSKY